MILRDKNLNQKKAKLKTWQWAIIALVALLFVTATVILCVFYKDAIFTENTLAVTLICVSALIFIACGIITFKYFRR